MKEPPPASEDLASPALSPRDARAIEHANSMVDTSPRQAQAMLAAVVRRNPMSPAAWRAYTLSLMNHFEQSRCRAALARWQALAPDDPLLPAVHAGLAYSTLDFEEALRWATRALDGDPRDFQMLWAKAMCERFLGRPAQAASFAKAREADPARFGEEADRIRSLEAYGSLELQNAFEAILLIGTASDEGDVARARRLLEQSKREPVLPDAWVAFRKTQEKRLEAAERRTRGGALSGRAPPTPSSSSSSRRGPARSPTAGVTGACPLVAGARAGLDLGRIAAANLSHPPAPPALRQGDPSVLRLEDWTRINELARRGMGIRAIARTTGISRNTVSKYLEGGPPAPGTRSRGG